MACWVSDTGDHLIAVWPNAQSFRCRGLEVRSGKCAAEMYGALLRGEPIACPWCATTVFAIVTGDPPEMIEVIEIPF